MVGHDILIDGVDLSGTLSPNPAIVAMFDSDFANRFFADLGQPPAKRISSAHGIDCTSASPGRLLQPVQRTLNVAMLDLACDTVGRPRLDPGRIESSGLVIRRVQRPDGVNDRIDLPPEGWMKTADGRFGWMKLTGSQPDNDPDPARRMTLRSGQAELDRLLSETVLAAAVSETVNPVFLAPPIVSDRMKRTIAYSVIPTASSDVSDTKPLLPALSIDFVAGILPPLLQEGDHRAPFQLQTIDYRFASEEYLGQANVPTEFLAFLNLMRLLANGFGAFDGTAEGKAVIQALNRRNVSYGKTSVALGVFLSRANDVLFGFDPAQTTPPSTLQMPDGWDSFSTADQNAIALAVSAKLKARSAQVLAPEGRFQDSTRLYTLRIFLRVRDHAGDCPPQLVWSAPSGPFLIAPWYASTARLGPPIPLPNLTRAFLQSAKPNVSFVVPGGLMNAMQSASLKNLSAGSAQPGGGGIGIAWLCGFSIPAITICAFFVLNIFLQLLNIIFFWMFWIKICIPIPVPAALAGKGDQ